MVFDNCIGPMGDLRIRQNKVIDRKEKSGKREVYLVKNINRARSTYPERVKIGVIDSR